MPLKEINITEVKVEHICQINGLRTRTYKRQSEFNLKTKYKYNFNSKTKSTVYFGCSIVALARSVILGYLILCLSSSFWDQRIIRRRLHSFGLVYS